jgi:hypothetical protein
MSAVTELITERRTNSGLCETDVGSATRQLGKDDWWFLKSAPNNGRTTIEVKDEQSRPPEAVTRLRPLRKDSIGIKLGGDRKVLLQQWECVVLERDNEVVRCELHDLTDESRPIEYAEIYIEQFNSYDVPLIVEGAVFYWSLGYIRKPKGQVKNISEFIIRRMPKLNRGQASRIAEKVAKLSGLLNGK